MKETRFRFSILFVLALLWLTTGCTVKWQFPADSPIVSTPALASDGTIYFNSMKFLYALSPKGKLRWRYSPGDAEFKSSPVVGPDGSIYVADTSCVLHAVNPDGSRRWLADLSRRDSPQPSGTICGNPPTPTLIPAGILVVDKIVGFASVVDPATGTMTARFTGWGTSINSSASPEVASDTLVMGSGSLQSIDSFGNILWTVNLSDGRHFVPFRTPPAITDSGVIAIAGWDDKLHVYKSDGSLAWEVPGEWWANPVIASDGTIYVGGMGNTGLVALRSDGTKLWEAQIIGPGDPAIAADGTLYVPGRYANESRPPSLWPSWLPWFFAALRDPWKYALYTVTADGTVKSHVDVRGPISSGPAIGPDGTIYFGTSSNGAMGPKGDSGILYAVRGSSPLMAGGWPKSCGSPTNDGHAPANRR